MELINYFYTGSFFLRGLFKHDSYDLASQDQETKKGDVAAGGPR